MEKSKRFAAPEAAIRLWFWLFAAAALIAAVCMPDRGQMFAGLGRLCVLPYQSANSYFDAANGGFAGTFLNVALVCAICAAVYSINIAVMGNTSLLNMNKTETVFTKMQSALEGTFLAGQQKLAVSLIAVALVIVFLSLFLRTKLGLAIRATGNNPDMVKSSSIDPVFTTTVGLCVANAFTALSGCLLAQAQKSVNIDIGSGMVTIALASLLIGGMFFRRRGVALRAVGAVLGAFLFRLVYTLALRFDMPASMLKLVSSVIVIIAISGPYLKGQLPLLRRRAQMRKEVR